MTEPRRLGNRYEIGDTLGHGGMAEVHLGRDVRLGREVAVKVLRADLARDPSFQTRFRREAQAAASLNHPAIVAVYDTGEDRPDNANGATPYIVMEYVKGRTLREILKAEGPLHPQRAMEITADICAALDFSHRNGIIHRDVKPGNVMITANGAVKVMDFGIARAIADNTAAVTQTAAVIGTAQYLSPEQARGEPVDPRSDVYSTGCLLYELITGRPPFTGDSPVAVAYQHVREDPVPPSSSNPDVPPTLDAIVLKSMAKNPMNRYQSAAEMRSDLARAIAGRAVRAEPIMSEDERTTILGSRTGETSAMPRPNRPAVTADNRSPNRRAWLLALLGIGVIAAFVVGAFVVSNLVDDKAKATQIQVPRVVGKTVNEARSLIEDKKLQVGEQKREPSESPENQVIRQDPEEGNLPENGKINLTISSGPDTVIVPDLAGSNRQGAISALSGVGLNLGNTSRENSDTIPMDAVIRSIPAANEKVAKGRKVDIVVSSGKAAPTSVQVPDVTHQTRGQASALLTADPYNLTPRFRFIASDQEKDTVVAQNPTAGSTVAPGSPVELSISTGEGPDPTDSPSTGFPTIPPPTTTPPTSPPPVPTSTPTVPPRN